VHLRPPDAAAEDEWRAFLAEHDFGQLIAPGKGRTMPMVVPVHFVLRGNEALLHLVRTNPVWAYLEEEPSAVLAVVGAYAYVPSDINGGQDDPPTWGVPTSYYAAVQLEGRCHPVDEPREVAALLQAMVDHFEPGAARGRRPVSLEAPDGPQLKAIRGIRFEVTGVRAKFKFGGNRTPEHRRSVAAFLEEQGTDLAREAADHTLRRTPG
jgi:transcriptional regulator